MCGIIGYIGKKQAKEVILNGLKQLEYRGYDSAGVALCDNQNKVHIFKDKGRVSHLETIIDPTIQTTLGIGHTRWATHGKPNQINSHPHQSQNKRFTIVHNGVIDNFKRIKAEYLKEVTFISETDTEVIVNLIELYSHTLSVRDAIRKTMSKLEGSYAFLLLDEHTPDRLYVCKNKAPMHIGISEHEFILASDVIPLAGHCSSYIIMQDLTFAEIRKDGFSLYDIMGTPADYQAVPMNISIDEISKGNFEHYMLKEIHEQPGVIRNLVSNYFVEEEINIDKEILDAILSCDKINFVACGTSMYASYMAKYYFEKLCGIPSEVFVASELVYSTPLIKDKPIFIYLSQSGETADSIAVMKKFKAQGFPAIAITNSKTSTMNSIADYTLDICAGTEIAVASTKAYMAQVVVCAILAKALTHKTTNLKNNLNRIALAIEHILDQKEVIKQIAEKIKDSNDVFYIGRGIDYWACLESALKLKEIAYIHTEAFSSGELKHGSIALITEGTPVIAICTQESTNAIVRSNLAETVSRGALPVVISMETLSESEDDFIVPDVAHYLSPLVSVAVTQLLAYYSATLKGNDVDKPKNLAKSVTVE